MSRLTETASFPTEAAAGHELWQKHQAEYARRLTNELIPLARLARDKFAESHRHFLVGCAALAWNGELKKYEVFVAGNATPAANLNRTGASKRCAEREALDMINKEKDSGWEVVALVTVTAETSTEPTDRSNEHGVLHPCGECKKMLEQSPLINDETIVCNVNDTKLVDDDIRVKILEPEEMVKEESTVATLLGR